MDADEAVGIYRTMSLIKQCDEKIRALLTAGTIAVVFYSPRGQEAVAAGVSANLTGDDYLVTTYRGLHDQIAKGFPLRPLWAEILGRRTGACKGKGGPMHLAHPGSGVMVTTGIVGGGIPIANGLALASKLRGENRVTVCNFGDGASNIGAFHEALNLASLWKLPVLFVCQNNLYAECSRFADGTASAHVADRAQAYQMPGVTVDGNDPIAVYEAAHEAIERARSGGGPTLLEAMTFRFHGHYFGDPGQYIPRDELKAAIAADPVPRFRTRLLDEGLASPGQLDEIDEENRLAVDDAAQYAMDSEFPPEHEVTDDVFIDGRPARSGVMA